MLILDKVEMPNIKHEQLRIQFAQNFRIKYVHIYIFINIFFHKLYCCNVSLTNCKCFGPKPGISKNSLRVRLQV